MYYESEGFQSSVCDFAVETDGYKEKELHKLAHKLVPTSTIQVYDFELLNVH